MPLPTRCIQIGRKNLVLKETAGETGAYIALSHRWNEETELCKTTTKNVEERRRGRGLHSLPKLFADAIAAAQALDIQYMWIDSLCIIQGGDNGQDWKREAVKMAQYYQEAVLVIATTAESKEAGLFPVRTDDKPESLVKMPYRDISGSRKGHFYVYERSSPPATDYFKAVADSAFAKRGWIFQERLLSRRMIFYTSHGIYFECRTEYPKSIDQNTIYPVQSVHPLDQTSSLRRFFHAASFSGIELWYKMIIIYSNTELTYPGRDRMLAISGVAKEFRDMMTEKLGGKHSSLGYLAGLWLCDVHFGLLWQQESAQDAGADNGSLPSWSWASTMRAVRWPGRLPHTKNVCKIIGLLENDVEYSVEGAAGSESQRFESKEQREHIARIFDAGTGYTGLVIRGYLQLIVVRGKSATGDVAAMLRHATNAATLKVTDDTLRPTCSIASRNLIGGWGSFENSKFQEQLRSYDATIAHALLVSTSHATGPTGVMNGLFKTRGDVHSVLYVVPIGGRQFRRIGAGRVFEKDVFDGFRKAGEQVIELL